METRRITGHEINGVNQALAITADDLGAGGASHRYLVEEPGAGRLLQLIEFQNGPVREQGINGITNEALLAIVRDRLQCFQAGPYACRENALALTKIEESLHWLHHRTRTREERGVEGTSAQ